MTSVWRTVLFLGLLLGTATPSGARASTIEAATLEELSRGAAEIAVVTVIESRAEWALGRILTRHRVRVDQAVKGPARAGDVIEIVTAGGVADGVGMQVAGEARLRAAERYLVLLESTSLGFRVAGMAQGCLRVVTGATGTIVEADDVAMHLVRRQGGLLRPSAGPLPVARALEDVLREIEGYVRAP